MYLINGVRAKLAQRHGQVPACFRSSDALAAALQGGASVDRLLGAVVDSSTDGAGSGEDELTAAPVANLRQGLGLIDTRDFGGITRRRASGDFRTDWPSVRRS